MNSVISNKIQKNQKINFKSFLTKLFECFLLMLTEQCFMIDKKKNKIIRRKDNTSQWFIEEKLPAVI